MAVRLIGDPEVQWLAAGSCGKLVAQRILTPADMVPRLLSAAVRAGYRGCLIGLQARLTWHIHDTAWHWDRRRREMRWTIRRRLQPLLGVASGQVLLHAADHANVADHEPLLWREVKQVVDDEVAAWFRANTRKHRYVR